MVDTIDFVHNLGLNTFAMNGMIYAGGGRADPAAIPSEEMAALLDAVRERAESLDMRFLWYTVTDYCRFSPLALGLRPNVVMPPNIPCVLNPTVMYCPCQSYYVSAGNILSDSWQSIWNSDIVSQFPQSGDVTLKLPDCRWNV